MDNQPEETIPDTGQRDSESRPVYAWYVVVVLMLAYMVSFVDRQILSLMVEPIRADLGLTDTELSLLHGFAFALFYTALGIPLGWLADRKNRRNLMAAGMAAWGAATIGCGFTSSFWQLFGMRTAVGVGEAALSPAAYSLISDYFAPEKRGRAIGVYSMGVFIGAGVAYIVGGAAVEMADGAAARLAEMGLDFRPWQLVFVFVGMPALLLIALMATIKEPVRHERGELSGEAVKDFRAGMSDILSRRKLYLPVILGVTMTALVNYGFFAWIPSYFIRTFGWSAGEIATSFGVVLLTFGTAGMWIGGYVSDRLLAKGQRDAHLKVLMWCAIGGIPAAALFSFMTNPMAALFLVAVLMFFMSAPAALGPVLLQAITPNEQRGQVTAVYLFILNIIALGMGPSLIAATSDYVFKDEMAIGQALGVVTVAALPLAAYLFYRARRYMV